MATPQQIEAAAQHAATQLTAQGNFNHSSSKIKAASGVENPLSNGFTKEEKAKVAEIVTDRLDQAKQIIATLPTIKESRDQAATRQEVSTKLKNESAENRKFFLLEAESVDPNSAEGIRLAGLIQDNTRGMDQARENALTAGEDFSRLDEQMKQVTKSALGAAIKGDPTDLSANVKRDLADKAAAAAIPKESKSFIQSIKSKFS